MRKRHSPRNEFEKPRPIDRGHCLIGLGLVPLSLRHAFPANPANHQFTFEFDGHFKDLDYFSFIHCLTYIVLSDHAQDIPYKQCSIISYNVGNVNKWWESLSSALQLSARLKLWSLAT